MNQLWQNFNYLPVDVEAGDNDMLREIYKLAEKTPNIVAINQTQPHKSNAVLREFIESDIVNVDTLIKDDSGHLHALNLNGPAFIDWLRSEVDSISRYNYIVLGVGGVGEPIARELHTYRPKALVLVDQNDKKSLAEELSATYHRSLEETPLLPGPTILINAAGKEGANVFLNDIFGRYSTELLTYIDIRPHLEITEVNQAKNLGFDAYTGHGMNARNDYVLTTQIAKLLQKQAPSFEVFQRLVAAAS